ncbi:choice-of-anchor D domain-containing protein [Vulgatibacter sp.]|uniref:choice-of-anchor D domain-containing protein n=1 Tax=Vulgatibacter sp. TaxID=1971226 RepID=UPI00356233C7
MGVQVPGRNVARGPRDVRNTELGKLGYGVAIAAFLAMAALLLSGCDSGRIRSVTGDLEATPSPLNFGVVAVERTVSKTIVLRNNGDAPLRITGIEALGDLPSAFVVPDVPSEPIPVAGSREISFGFLPGDEQAYAGQVVFITDSAEQRSITIDLAGEGARPRVDCTESLDFGRIVLNTDKVLRATCVNAGRVDAELRVAGREGEDAALFTIGENLVADPTVVPVGASQLVEVRYTATFLGPASARALLEIPGALEPVQVVELTGEGFASDLVATPNCIHFGSVSPGTVATREVTVYNGGNRTVTFDDPRLLDTSGVFGITRTVVEGVEGPLETLAPQEQAQLTVAFAPTANGAYAGDLQVRSDDPTNPRLQICLTGNGGGADILVQPSSLDFGTIGAGMRARAWVTVRNGGTGEGGPLEIDGVEVDAPESFTARQPTVTVLEAAGGAVSIIEVEFHPQDVGTWNGNLIIRTNDGDTPAFEVPLTGEAKNLPPCSYAIEPPSIRFGAVQRGATATLAAALRNTGTEECVFSSVALAPGTDSVFTQPGGAVGVATVLPGEALTVPVQFDATQSGSFGGAIGFYVSDPVNPQGSIPITGSTVNGCLSVTPGAVDFGQQRISCPAVSRSIRLTNTCTTTVQVTSAALGAGTYATGELQLVAAPTLPLNIPAGGSATFNVRYDPIDEGHDGAPLLFATSVYDITVPVYGSGTSNNTRTDSFQQAERSSVDVLFVIDNSGSMMEEQQAVGEAFDDFINYAVAQGIDYHIGVTTTGITPSGGGWAACPGGVDGGEGGRLFPATNERARYLTPTTPNAVAVFQANVQVGVCHWWEEGLEAAYRAVSTPLVDNADAPNTSLSNDGNLGFYRPDARLSVIIVTDEDDHSDKEPSFYVNFFRNLKGAANADRVTVHGVLGNGCSTASGNGDRYSQVIAATGGTTESICTTDWGRSLVNLAQETFGFSLRFPLTGTPTGAVTVRVDGRIVNSGWTYDGATNSVVFTETTAPAPGSSIDISYTPACGT